MKRIWKIVMLNVAFAIILIAALFIKEDSTEIILGVIAGSISIYISLNKIWIEDDKVFKELFIEFNKKFDDLNDKLNIVLNPEVTTDEKTIQDYLNLCSEEYLWYKKGRIDKKVWKSWKKGIEYYLRNEEIKEYFKAEKSYNESYYGLFDELELLL